MTGMTILGVAVHGGIFDLVVAADFIVNWVFGSASLSWPAQLATWSAIVVTIALTMLAVLRGAARVLNASLDAIEHMVVGFKKACRCVFWDIFAAGFKAIARWALQKYRWARGKRK